MVRIEEVQSMSAHARHKAVRVLYHTKTAFKKSAKGPYNLYDGHKTFGLFS